MAKGKILFVDDDNFLRKVYQAELKEKGFDVYLAVDGDDGFKKAQELKPDLIILDLIMPNRNGFEFLADAQIDALIRLIPIIVLSNLAQSDDQERALTLGAVDYLVKDNTTLDIIADKINYYLSPSSKAKLASRPVRTAPQDAAVSVKEKVLAGESPRVVATPEDASKAGHNFCPQCGAHITKKDKFCPHCGAAQ